MDSLAAIGRALQRGAVFISEWLDRHPVPAWCVFSTVFFSAAVLRAARRAFWFDELVTLFLCRLPGMGEVWRAFEEGADAMPPLLHLLTRASIGLLGEGHVSQRLPAILGVWTMCLCLYLFVRRRCPAVYGWMAVSMMACTMVTNEYAVEARSYGLQMGFIGLALVCWQGAPGRHRSLWLGGLACSVAAAVFCHPSALIVVAVLGLGERMRAPAWRAVDWPVFGALLGGSSAILILLPGLLAAGAAYSGNAWSAPRWTSIPETYGFLLRPVLVPLCGAFLLSSAAWVFLRLPSPETAEVPAARMPRAEAAVAVALQFLPVFALLGAKVAGVFVPRYALPSLAGFCLTAAFLSRAAGRQGRVFPIVCVALFLASMGVHLQTSARSAPARAATWASATRADAGLPIVVADPVAYLQHVYYAPADLAPRLCYLADAERERRVTGSNSATTGLVKLARWAPLRLEDAGAFLVSHRRFYLLDPHPSRPWLCQHLLAAGASIRLLQAGRSSPIYLVEMNR